MNMSAKFFNFACLGEEQGGGRGGVGQQDQEQRGQLLTSRQEVNLPLTKWLPLEKIFINYLSLKNEYTYIYTTYYTIYYMYISYTLDVV